MNPGSRRSPALTLWRRELAAALRTRTTFDDLWRAACAEQLAEDMEADGVPTNAVARRKEAAAIIRQAAAAQAPVPPAPPAPAGAGRDRNKTCISGALEVDRRLTAGSCRRATKKRAYPTGDR